MSESKAPETGAEAPSVPGVDVKIYLPKDPDKDHGKLLGFASVNLGGVFAVNNIRIYNTEKGPYVAMPSTKGQDEKYHPICCPTTKEMRQALNAAVLGAYEKAVEQERPPLCARRTQRGNQRGGGTSGRGPYPGEESGQGGAVTCCPWSLFP